MPDWNITTKLLGLLARYEMGDTAFIQYEVRAYKRATRNTDTLRTEKLVFKIITLDPNKNSVVKNRLSLKKLAVLLGEIGQEKYEMQILKYFDITAWIRKKFSHQRSGEEQKHVA